jgi:hypothetical protein
MLEGVNVPPYWVRPPQVLSKQAGMQRFIWDLRYAPPAGANFSYPIAAIYRNTPRVPGGPWVAPGTYTVRLMVDGKAFRQPLAVRMDPRVTTSALGLQEQQRLSLQLYEGIRQAFAAQQQVRGWRAHVRSVRERASATLATSLDDMDRKLAGLDAGTGDNLGRLHSDLSSLLNLIQGADVTPTTQARDAAAERMGALDGLLVRVSDLRAGELTALNAQLRAAGLPVLSLQPVSSQ